VQGCGFRHSVQFHSFEHWSVYYGESQCL
jgi:hypothetical protein